MYRVKRAGSKSSYLIYIVALLGCLALLSLSLFERLIHIDDAWLAEQAYYLAKISYVKSELWRGLLGYEDQLFVYHKLFIRIGAQFIKTFGFSATALKSISLFSYALTALIMTKYLVREGFSSKWIYIGLIFFTTNAYVFEYSFVFRPEMLLMSLGLASFILTKTYLTTHRRVYLFAAAIVGGLSVFTHLNGLVFLSGCGLLLLSQRKFSALLVFSAVSLLVSGLYFTDLSSSSDFSSFLYQFQNDPALVGSKVSLLDRLVGIIAEHMRWFSHAHNSSFSLLVFACLGLGWKHQDRRDLWFLLGTALGLGLISHGKTGKYVLLYLPLLIFIILRTLKNPTKARKLLFILIALFLIINTEKNIRLIRDSFSIKKYNQLAFRGVPKGSTVVTYLPAVFDNGIEEYDLIADKLGEFQQVRYSGRDFDVEQYVDDMEKLGATHFVLSKHYTHRAVYDSLKKYSQKEEAKKFTFIFK